MTREDAIKWLKMESSKPIRWDDYSEESKQIREDAEHHIVKAFDMAIDALKAQEPRTCSECRHYDTNAFTDMGGRCRNSRSCHYCYECDKSFGCNAWEGR